MMLSPDRVTLRTPEVSTARRFYEATFAVEGVVADDHVDLDIHGTGRLRLTESDQPAPSGFDGQVLIYIVEQPGEVEKVLATAVANGATVVKPGKKALFAGYSAVFGAPDGSVWKLAAPTGKNTGPVSDDPRPTETNVLLGVAAPQASKTFYRELGMVVDRDYGNKYVDFTIVAGACRFGVMRRRGLAKDVGIDDHGADCATVFHHTADSREEADALLAAAEAAGGRVTAKPEGTDGYGGEFTDLDGYHWMVTIE
ncbi:putative lactoylglutathione lyase [Stackebrandtia endophytica]|uniref:Putative lactoylglutathione lyase n=1 Tax=Stackebrandtia endophytica TaxID=1496996 RepID=A0A543AR78_9ACTN|nr:VOC family protein [Stackebrandtia endophytica]TQL75098.1 putative lactoylglutathione lyase [Stackebrandtia endophytica]